MTALFGAAVVILCVLLLNGCTAESCETFDENGNCDMIHTSKTGARAETAPVIFDSRGVPATAAIIPANGLWSGNNQLGYETPFAADNQNRQTILKLDEWGPPEIWTIGLYLIPSIPAQTAGRFDITAEISYGAGGSTQVVNLDWMIGNQISLPMNAVNIIASYPELNPTDLAGVRLGVQLARGARANTSPPIYTVARRVDVANSTFFSVPIPKLAKRMVAVPSDVADVAQFFSVTTSLYTESGNVVGSEVISATTGNVDNGVEVRSAAHFFTVHNTGTNTLTLSIYAELDG